MKAHAKDAAIWGVVPAAGMSRRMGFPKQSATIGGVTLAATVVQNMLDAGVCGVVVVTRSELLSALALPNDPRISTAINDDSSSQMLDSIKIGVAAITKTPRPSAPRDGIMVVPSDMPAISASTYRACVTKFRDHPDRIIIATHNNRRGHPIVFPFSMRQELDTLSEGLRELPDRFADRVVLVETTDEATLLDLDIPEDFETL